MPGLLVSWPFTRQPLGLSPGCSIHPLAPVPTCASHPRAPVTHVLQSPTCSSHPVETAGSVAGHAMVVESSLSHRRALSPTLTVALGQRAEIQTPQERPDLGDRKT